MEGRAIPPDALFHSIHLGPEFRVLCLLMSVPNRVWDSMGSPCLTCLASNSSSGGPSCFYHSQTLHIRLSGRSYQMSFKSYRASGTVFLLVQIFAERGMPTCFADVIPTCRETEEANSRDGRLLSWVSTLPGAIRNCSLLVRGTMSYRISRN